MGEQSGDKTEEPTPHRLKEARDKGQIAKSKEITAAFLLLASYAVLRYTGGSIWSELSGMIKSIYGQIPYTSDFGYAFVGSMLMIGLRAFAMCVAPLMAVTFIIAILAEALQTQGAMSGDPLTAKLERINPLEGFKRLVSMQGLVELVKSLVKILLVFWIAWGAAKDDLPYVIGLISAHPWEAMLVGGTIAYNIAVRVGIFYIFIAALDYMYRRWEYMKNLKMTKQEIKEEYKRLEGDPQIKQRMRDLQRAMSSQRMMASVPGADVVVTNPVHLAVALRYEAPRMKSPIVLAKGKFEIAEEIKRIADKHNVPIVENEPLAQSIYKTTKVGMEVPPDLFQAVAEVLAFVYKVKKDRVRRKKDWLGPLEGIRTASDPFPAARR